MATNTAENIGIRHNIGILGPRNFENSGTVQYKCRSQGMVINGVTLNVGDTIAFDVGGVSYSLRTLQVLEVLYNARMIDPVI